MNRIAQMSSRSVSLRSFANPEKGDPNSGMTTLLSSCLSDPIRNVRFNPLAGGQGETHS